MEDFDTTEFENWMREQMQGKSVYELTNTMQLVMRGYKWKGKLCELPFYEKKEAFERIHVWEKPGEEPVYAVDQCNSWCLVLTLKEALKFTDDDWFKSVLPKGDYTEFEDC